MSGILQAKEAPLLGAGVPKEPPLPECAKVGLA